MELKKQNDGDEKKVYEAPKLEEYGSLTELTLGGPAGSTESATSDFVF